MSSSRGLILSDLCFEGLTIVAVWKIDVNEAGVARGGQLTGHRAEADHSRCTPVSKYFLQVQTWIENQLFPGVI